MIHDSHDSYNAVDLCKLSAALLSHYCLHKNTSVLFHDLFKNFEFFFYFDLDLCPFAAFFFVFTGVFLRCSPFELTTVLWTYTHYKTWGVLGKAWDG